VYKERQRQQMEHSFIVRCTSSNFPGLFYAGFF